MDNKLAARYRLWRRMRLWTPIAASVCVVVGIAIGVMLARVEMPENNYSSVIGDRDATKLQDVIRLISTSYADEVRVDSLTEMGIVGLLRGLDPHSVYINTEETRRVNEEMAGSFSGIGVQFDILEDTVRVVAVIHGGPSERAGLQPGDRIVTVDDSVFTGPEIDERKVMKTLRGEKGTKARLGIMRGGDKEVYTYEIIRGDVVTKSIGCYYMADRTTGYVKVHEFTATTYQEFLTAINILKKRGARRFVIDLRDNPGGYLDAVTAMANEFLDEDEMIVYAEGQHYPRYEYRADGQGICKDAEVKVLVNEFSASASEIFAAAMQDNDRGEVIGRRTFGKGLVQQQFPLADGSAVRLTVAHFYSPSGRCIQKPYTRGRVADYEKEVFDRFNNGELTDSTKRETEEDTTNVYHTKGGRVVHGGGGVTPDVFVARDTSYWSRWMSEVNNKGMIVDYAYLYADEHRGMDCHEVDGEELLKGFVAYVKGKGVETRKEDVARSGATVKRLLRAYVTRSLSQDEAEFYKIFNEGDAAIAVALKR